MKWEIKPFTQLTTKEFYEITQLRIDVFVVEQNCPYRELDGLDEKAFHVIGRDEEQVVAYSRLFSHGVLCEQASIGRVLVRASKRNKGYGKELLNHSIHYLEEQCGTSSIKIMAQHYLERFYQSFGFITVSGVYDDEGIPHVDMIREVKRK
ncbi:GNAT family N-acetyltransferase [Halalkalibacter urbisdiaboli]|uniref:GNAT family N-acetyltransferase n=1 Tax=Halalkalibacter urbisdiaboli TaxID=1960589 RepID=UPI000B4520C3|nr:GNAT family N-acetyltransferase [Halalkalibacter urbisdiaboli]